jgi:hypothetical protein
MANGLGLKKLGTLPFPCFTQAEAFRQVSGLYLRQGLKPNRMKFLSRWMSWQR